jgi:large subunit ribosomal protein L10
MKRTDKEALVTDLRDRMESAKAIYYTDFTGLNVKRMTELRRRLRKAGIEYVVIKNTLAQRAVAEVGLPVEKLRGPTGVVIGKDPVAAAKLWQILPRSSSRSPK